MFKSIINKMIREPLVHFLALTVTLFVMYGIANPEVETSHEREILVTRGDLLTFMQYRAKAFDAGQFEALYDKLSEQERERLIAEFVREEAMYREAQALELGRNDYVAKRRLIQQLEFIAQDFFDESQAVSEDVIAAYFEANKAAYTKPSDVTFTHVFFSDQINGPEQADALAKRELEILNSRPVPFHEAMRHGDRALFHVNYVQKDIESVESHFGDEMARTLFALKPDETLWRGPFRSEYGAHLVLLTYKRPASTPTLKEAGPRVAADALASIKKARLQSAIADIVATYNVRLSDDIDPKLNGAGS